MENHDEEQIKGDPPSVPEELREEVTDWLTDVLNKLAQRNISPQEAKDLIENIIDEGKVQFFAGAIEPDPEGGYQSYASPLTQLQAAVWVAETAEVLVHVYAQAASADGYTWNQIAEAAGLKSGQAAYYKWGRGKSKELVDAFAENVNEANAPWMENTPWRPTAVPLSMLVPHTTDGPKAAPVEVRWKTAAALGRDLGKDPRTIREMAARGELETQKRPPGKDGRVRDLFRVKHPEA